MAKPLTELGRKYNPKDLVLLLNNISEVQFDDSSPNVAKNAALRFKQAEANRPQKGEEYFFILLGKTDYTPVYRFDDVETGGYPYTEAHILYFKTRK